MVNVRHEPPAQPRRARSGRGFRHQCDADGCEGGRRRSGADTDPAHPESGTKLRVVWTLSFVKDGQRRLFTAEGVFIRLFAPDGSRSPRVNAFQPTPGRYRATVTVPRGGVRKVVIGLMGMRCDGPAGGGCLPAPGLFPIAGMVFR